MRVFLFFLLSFILLIGDTLTCETSRVVPESQKNPPKPPPARASQCGHSLLYNAGEQFSANIIGGVDAQQYEFPWQARLRIITEAQTYLCGATVINNKWVATAAHCARAATGTGTIIVVFGDYDRSKGDQGEKQVASSEVIIHPNYNNANNADYDIAMIQVQNPVNYTGAVQPICLPTSCSASACQGGSAAWITGWGTVEADGKSGVNILQKAWVPIVSNRQCQTAYSQTMTNITDRMLCAGFAEGGVDTCRGDSGGPLVCNYAGFYELGGITSFGQGCASKDYYGVYVRICTLVDWIKSIASQ